jgi:hypothetical protein
MPSSRATLDDHRTGRDWSSRSFGLAWLAALIKPISIAWWRSGDNVTIFSSAATTK